jgi:hypothetical protein
MMGRISKAQPGRKIGDHMSRNNLFLMIILQERKGGCHEQSIQNKAPYGG